MVRSIAINVQELLDGTPAEQLQTTFALGENLAINMATARAIGVYPGWGMLTEAELLNEEDAEIQRKLNIRQAVDEALEANPDLAVAKRRAGRYPARQRGPLAPAAPAGDRQRSLGDRR